MKEHPILFSAPMVRAILEGRKTQTRRLVKMPFIKAGLGNFDGIATKIESHPNGIFIALNDDGGTMILRPKWEVGDRLWVRETFAEIGCIGWPIDKFEYAYRADFAHNDGNWEGYADMCFGNWKPSIHMPRSASRITLEITDVRCERLNEISEADAEAEGIESGNGKFKSYYQSGPESLEKATDSFYTLWNSINGLDSWKTNPFVWVITFIRL